MYIHRTRLAPAIGKEGEARDLLADHVRHLQGQGQRLALSQRIFSTEGPTLLVPHFAGELDEIERARRARLTDQDFRTRADRVLALLREPPRSVLWESVVDPPPNPPPTRIGQLVSFFPATGKDRQVVDVLTEAVFGMQQMGQRASLWRRIYSSDGPVIQVLVRYADLAELERARDQRAEQVRQATPVLAELVRAPLQHRLTETVVAPPPA